MCSVTDPETMFEIIHAKRHGEGRDSAAAAMSSLCREHSVGIRLLRVFGAEDTKLARESDAVAKVDGHESAGRWDEATVRMDRLRQQMPPSREMLVARGRYGTLERMGASA